MCRPRDPYLWLSFGVAFVSLASPLLALSGYDLASQFQDDAFYYFQIARNVANGHGFSFDGLHATNGFHPLWLFSLVPIFASTPDLDLGVRLAGLLEATLISVACSGLYLGLRNRIGREPALLAGLLLCAPGTRRSSRTGLEGALELCLLVALWYALYASAERRHGSWLKAGVIGALATLARLEALGAVLAIAVWELPSLGRDSRKAAALLGPPVVGLAAYTAWNRLAFDTWLPISGMIKSSNAARLGYALPGGLHVSRAAPWVVLAVCAMMLAWWLGRRTATAATLRELGWMPLGTMAMLMLGADLTVLGSLADWYRVPALPMLAVAIAVVLHRRRRLVQLSLLALILLALGRIPFTIHGAGDPQNQAHIRGRAADWLRSHTPEGSRIGSWNGGMLGYYTGRPVIMLDGLANDIGYYRRVMVLGDLRGYLRDEGIALLATASCNLPKPGWLGEASQRALIENYVRVGPLTEDTNAEPCENMTLWQMRHD